MLYTFTKLTQKLDQLGYPKINQSTYRIIKRDLTHEELAGNVEFRNEGVFLNVEGQEYMGYMYIKRADIQRYDYPKFHITNCETIIDQRNRGAFDNKYYWSNSKIVNIEDRSDGTIHENVVLKLCNYCRKHASNIEYLDTEGFVGNLEDNTIEKDNGDIEDEVDINGYTRDWAQISRNYKKGKEFKCEICGIQITNSFDKRFIHTDHKNGNKVMNNRNNLQCLCILCHSYKDDIHQHNSEKRRMQMELNSFVKKYYKELENIGNPYIQHHDNNSNVVVSNKQAKFPIQDDLPF